MNKKIILIILLTCFSIQSSYAGWAVEPYLAYESGVWNQTAESDTYEADMVGGTQGIGYGLKVLFAAKRFFWGFNYYTSNLDWGYVEIDDEDFDDDWTDIVKTSRSSASVLGGIQFSKGYLSLNYYLLNKLTFAENIIEDKDAFVLNGSGFSVGFNYFIYKRMTLGIEYITSNYKAPDEEDDVEYGAAKDTSLLFTLGFSFGSKSK